MNYITLFIITYSYSISNSAKHIKWCIKWWASLVIIWLLVCLKSLIGLLHASHHLRLICAELVESHIWLLLLPSHHSKLLLCAWLSHKLIWLLHATSKHLLLLLLHHLHLDLLLHSSLHLVHHHIRLLLIGPEHACNVGHELGLGLFLLLFFLLLV